MDECHGLRGKVLQSILVEHCANVPYRYGFTGTLPKEETDRMAVHISVGPVRHSISAKELMDINVLAQLDIDIVQLEEDLRAEYDQFCNECVIGANQRTKNSRMAVSLILRPKNHTFTATRTAMCTLRI